jgi:hypothetical protein
MVKSPPVGSVFALGAGFAGLLAFVFLVWRGWFDGPGGGMVIFPLFLVPAIAFGSYGFGSTLAKFRKARANSN